MKSILIIIAIVILVLVIITIIRYRPIKYDKAFIDEMASFCAQEFILEKYPEDQLYTKQGELKQKIINELENKKNELLYFYKAPNTNKKFLKYLYDTGLITDKKTVYAKNKELVFYNYNAFYENYKKNLQSNKSVFISLESFNIMKDNVEDDYVGVYVLYNQSKDMYYVGQAKRLFYRVSQHFAGYGNGDVYADYKYGDSFYVRLIKLSDSGFSNIDQLEKHYIDLYDAENNGYNKNKGNDI